jgi:phosphoesterase RecJ-like protein
MSASREVRRKARAPARTRVRRRRSTGRGRGRPRWQVLRPLLRRARQAVISTHINPDGDAIGSELALAAFLRQKGLRACIVNADPVPRLYTFLDPRSEILTPEAPAARRALEACDLFFAVDNGTLPRMGRMQEWIRSTRAIRVCIDHHASQDDLWDVRLIDEEACATGTLIYELIHSLGGRLTRAQAQAIYVALITDTGYFRFARTASTDRLAADLVDAGVDPVRVYHQVYERNSMAFIHLQGAALRDVRIELEGRLGWLILTRQQVVDAGADHEDTSEIINSVLTIEGVRAAVLFKELPGARTKVSLRSKGSLDVNALARRFGGGGHRNAAGILLQEPLERGVERVMAEVRGQAATL